MAVDYRAYFLKRDYRVRDGIEYKLVQELWHVVVPPPTTDNTLVWSRTSNRDVILNAPNLPRKSEPHPDSTLADNSLLVCKYVDIVKRIDRQDGGSEAICAVYYDSQLHFGQLEYLNVSYTRNTEETIEVPAWTRYDSTKYFYTPFQRMRPVEHRYYQRNATGISQPQRSIIELASGYRFNFYAGNQGTDLLSTQVLINHQIWTNSRNQTVLVYHFMHKSRVPALPVTPGITDVAVPALDFNDEYANHTTSPSSTVPITNILLASKQYEPINEDGPNRTTLPFLTGDV